MNDAEAPMLDDADEKKRGRLSASKYRCTNHVSQQQTSLREQTARQTARLSHMSPETLQIIMILKLNNSLWPNEKIVQENLDKLSEAEQY